MVWIKRFVKPSLPGRVWVGLLCFGLFAFSFQPVQAQTFAEWFDQQSTQIKYLAQQIAALQQYSHSVKQGYRIAQSGWDGIGRSVKGELDLHSAYYSSLKTVNVAIRNTPEADSIVVDARFIVSLFDGLNGLSFLDNDTRVYIGRVKTGVLAETDKDLSELQLVMTDDMAQLTDDERIKRLDAIYARVKDRLAFSGTFCDAVRMLVVQRNNSINDINTLKNRYGINN